MATKRTINLPNFDNVSAGQKALNSLFIGPRYHSITLDYQESGLRVNKATMITAIEEIVVKINSVEQWRITPAQLFDIEASYDTEYIVDDGLIHLEFSNRRVTGQGQQEATAIGTLGVNTFELEVKIASGRIAPTLTAVAEVDDVSEAPGLIRKLSSKVYGITATGPFKESIRRRGASYRAVHFFETTDGDVDNVRFQYEGQEMYDQDPDVIASMLRKYGYTAASKQIVLPFDRNVIGDAAPSQVNAGNGTLRDASMELTLQMGAAQNVTMVEDFYGSPNA